MTGLEWMLALATLATIGAFVIEKLSKIRAYGQRSTAVETGRTRRDSLIGSVLALLCATLWAASYASLDLVNDAASTLQINVYLMGYGALFLFLGPRPTRAGHSIDLTAPWRSGRGPVLVAANLGNFLLSVLALRFISASEAMTLTNLSPVVLAIGLWSRGKLRPSLGTFLALALVSLGVLFVSLHAGLVPRGGDAMAGFVIAFGAGVSWAVWTYTMDDLKDAMGSVAARMDTLALVFASSCAILAAIGYLHGGSSDLSTRDHLILLANGVRVAGVYLLYQLAVERAGPLLASVVLVLTVPLTFPFDSVWNHARVSPPLTIGAALIVVAAVGLLSDELRSSPRVAHAKRAR